MLEHPDYSNTVTHIDLVEGKDVTLKIEKGLTLRGRVVHEGKPVAGVGVHVAKTTTAWPLVNWDGKTDADGRFEVTRFDSAASRRDTENETVTMSVEG